MMKQCNVCGGRVFNNRCNDCNNYQIAEQRSNLDLDIHGRDTTNWCEIYITDKTGKKFWNTSVTYGFHYGELANIKRHFANIKKDPKYLITIDASTAKYEVVLRGEVIETSETSKPVTKEELEQLAKDLWELE